MQILRVPCRKVNFDFLHAEKAIALVMIITKFSESKPGTSKDK